MNTKKKELCIYCEKSIQQKLQDRVRKFCDDEYRI